MNLARNAERRLERLVEGIAGKMFKGNLHPVELASRLVREADLALTSTEIGPSAPNDFTVRVAPGAVEGDLPPNVLPELARAVEASAIDKGWRVEGPVRVTILEDPAVSAGSIKTETDVFVGPLPPWAVLDGKHGLFELHFNRTLIGRSDHADIQIPEPHVSRQHAVIWRDSAGNFVDDFRSANGTKVDGTAIDSATELSDGSVVAFGASSFTFRLV